MTDQPTRPQMGDELLPCPFCRAPAEMDTHQGYLTMPSGKLGTRVAIYCTSCAADMGLCREDHPDMPIEEMIWHVREEWNRRASTPTEKEAGNKEFRGAWASIAAERSRQIHSEGWSAQHDDAHEDGSMLHVAVIYLHWGTDRAAPVDAKGIPISWPWDAKWWKPRNRWRNLVRAGALCLAERERLLRRNPYGPVGHVDHKLDLVIEAMTIVRSASVTDAEVTKLRQLIVLATGLFAEVREKFIHKHATYGDPAKNPWCTGLDAWNCTLCPAYGDGPDHAPDCLVARIDAALWHGTGAPTPPVHGEGELREASKKLLGHLVPHTSSLPFHDEKQCVLCRALFDADNDTHGEECPVGELQRALSHAPARAESVTPPTLADVATRRIAVLRATRVRPPSVDRPITQDEIEHQTTVALREEVEAVSRIFSPPQPDRNTGEAGLVEAFVRAADGVVELAEMDEENRACTDLWMALQVYSAAKVALTTPTPTQTEEEV